MPGSDAGPTPADESTAVAANMAGDAVNDARVNDADLAGEPGTMAERERAGRRGDDPADEATDDATDEAP